MLNSLQSDRPLLGGAGGLRESNQKQSGCIQSLRTPSEHRSNMSMNTDRYYWMCYSEHIAAVGRDWNVVEFFEQQTKDGAN